MRPVEQMPRSSDEQQAENSAMHGELEAEKMPTSARTLGDQFGIHRHSPGDLHAQERLKGFHLGRGTRYFAAEAFLPNPAERQTPPRPECRKLLCRPGS